MMEKKYAVEMHKKGYFFIIDAIIALLIMSIGTIIVLNYNEFRPVKQQAFFVSSDVLGILANNKISNLNHPYYGINGELYLDGNITEVHNTLLEQVAEFYYRNLTKNCIFCLNLSRNLINYSTLSVSKEYNFFVRLNGVVLFERNNSPIERARIIIPSRTIVQGLYNKTELYGPYVVEVYAWQ
ncbi:MAG: hypothetical protein QXK37_00970 [Candidatus Woesearchaeota archaeon]